MKFSFNFVSCIYLAVELHNQKRLFLSCNSHSGVYTKVWSSSYCKYCVKFFFKKLVFSYLPLAWTVEKLLLSCCCWLSTNASVERNSSALPQQQGLHVLCENFLAVSVDGPKAALSSWRGFHWLRWLTVVLANLERSWFEIELLQ